MCVLFCMRWTRRCQRFGQELRTLGRKVATTTASSSYKYSCWWILFNLVRSEFHNDLFIIEKSPLWTVYGGIGSLVQIELDMFCIVMNWLHDSSRFVVKTR